jgi:DUF1365 family protein
MASTGMLRREALIRTDVSEELRKLLREKWRLLGYRREDHIRTDVSEEIKK